MTTSEKLRAMTITGEAWGKSHETQMGTVLASVSAAVILLPHGVECPKPLLSERRAAEELTFKIGRSVCKDHRAQQKGLGHQMARALMPRDYHTCAHTKLTEKELNGG